MENLIKNDSEKVSKNQILAYDELKDTDAIIENENSISFEQSKESIAEETILIKSENDEFEKIDPETNLYSDVNLNELTDSNSNPETEKIEAENASTTNCLALTIKEEHKLVAVKNVCLHSLKVTWKVIASTIALHILKLFF